MNLSLLAALGGLTILHTAAPVLLGFYLAALSSSRGRSVAWGLLGPLFYGLTALLVWSLSGADSVTMGILGGILGAVPAYVVIYAFEDQRRAAESPAPEADASASSEPASAEGAPATPVGTAVELSCPQCGSEGRRRVGQGDLLLCSDTSCNHEFFAFEAGGPASS